MTTLGWANTVAQASVLAIGLDELTLGRAALYRAVLSGESTSNHPPAGAAHVAGERLANAVDHLRASGHLDHIPGALCSRACLRFFDGDAEGARADLAAASIIAERGPMPLCIADVHLHRARLFADRQSLVEARAIIIRCGYHRRDPELADAEGAAR